MRKLSVQILVVTSFFFMNQLHAQQNSPYVRIAKLVIDSAQLDAYKAELRTGIETAIAVEPGVLSMYAVAEDAQPTHITILETYASKVAYQSHIQTAHFKRYKSNTLHMVKSLELIDVTPVVQGSKDARQ